jgi:hypothetical protein
MITKIPTKSALEELYKGAKENLHLLSKTVMDGLKPPAGAYAFFNNSAHTISRLEDCKDILDRLHEGRNNLNILSKEENELKSEDWPAGVPYPENVQEVMKKEGRVNSYMQLDLESLYIFGGILLDQWSLQAIAVGGLELNKRHPFVALFDFLQDGNTSVLDPVWEKTRDKMIWLHYQMRFYRNRFIVHANRPWQRGTTRSVIGEDYNLFTPTPPGWANDEELNKEILDLLTLLPSHIQEIQKMLGHDKQPDRMLRFIFNNIHNLPTKEEREKVANIYGRKGGLTPTFQLLAEGLFQFISEGTQALVEVAKNNLSTIDLGRPFATSQDMWEKHKKDKGL